MMLKHSIIATIMILFLIQGGFCQWEGAVLDTITDNQLDEHMSDHSFVMGSDGTMHMTYYREDTCGFTIYQYRRPDSNWSQIEYALQGAENLARASLPKNVRPDSVWMIGQYGLSLLLFIRGPMGDWIYSDVTPPNVNVASSDMAAVVDANGRWHAAFVSEQFGGGYDIYYGLYNGSAMEWQDLNAPVGPYGSGASPELVVDEDGIAHIFYRCLAWDYVINHTWNDTLGGHVWQTESLSNDNFDNYTAKAVLSREYGLCVAISGNDGFGFPGRIYYHRKPPESGWLPPELATGTGSAVNGRLTLDSYGHPMILWEQTSGNILTGNIYYARKTQQWENYPLITNDLSYYPQVLTDSQDRGNLIFTMNYYPDDEEIYFFGPEPSSSIIPSKTSPLPSSITLHPVYPNPLNAIGMISFSLPTAQDIHLGVHNILGQQVQSLATGYFDQGQYNFAFDASSLASGWYIISLETPGMRQVQPLIILK